MATPLSVWQPKSATGGISNNQAVTNLAAATASSNLTVGKRQKIAITVSPGGTAATTLSGASVRFSLGGSAAVAGDFILPLNSVTYWETGDEYDTVSFFNINASTGTINVSVMLLTP
jgi:hypothetical protein